MFEKILTDKPLPQTMIKAMYTYYEQSDNKISVGELYLMLKPIVSKLEEELEEMGMLKEVQQSSF